MANSGSVLCPAFLLAGALVLTPWRATPAADSIDIPSDAPPDALMARLTEVQQMFDWASLGFTGVRPPGPAPAVQVELRRQDHSSLRFGESCMETPIKLGQREFAHGLGTHANSEILLRLPPRAKAFRAWVGIDNNFDTGGLRGSVQFSVEVGGKEVVRTPTRKGSDPALPIMVDLPPGTREITLKTDTTPDGPSHDQADWAEAQVLLEDGSAVWADEDRQGFLARGLPFSFVYGGVHSSELFRTWERSVETKGDPGHVRHRVRWTDPAGALRVEAEVTVFRRYAAAEWVLYFENQATQDTPILEQVQALDVSLRTGYYRKPATLHQLVGDVCGERSFLPTETEVEPGKRVAFAPAGGRSSNGAFPFFNLQYGDAGLITAVGWSGQWAAALERSPAGPTRLQAGMELTHLRLHPGERIRTPRILVMPWKGDRFAAHNRFRRLLLFEYVPRHAGHPLQLPVALQCFDRYNWNRPDWGTEAGQVRAARGAHTLGCDTLWLDAAWFEGGFPDGVGNWFCKPQGFPNGLQPVSAACRQFGQKFMVWFEPERVAPRTQIAREHPEFVFGGAQGGLFKLSDPSARRWLTDLLSQRVTEFGLAVYRNDFNMDPLDFWRRNDAADRQGLTEIRYVEGLYALWDDLLRRHPGLAIDNCASGGRRIDLETISRSMPLWRSDTSCAPGHADWNQVQTHGLSLYLPLFCACAWTPEPYDLRSAATAGIICQWDFLDGQFDASRARAALAEAKANRPFWYGDFWPLTRATTGPEAWTAYQFHRADRDAGIVLAFRRSQCPYPVLQTGLRELKANGHYRVEFIEDAGPPRNRTLSGRALMTEFELRLPHRSSSLLVRYAPQ